MSHPVVLFAIPTLIWGATWYVITLQLGQTTPEVSVFYRFLVAAILAQLIFRIAKTPSKRLTKSQHFILAFQGFFLFCLNYILTYHSERFLPSGLVALIFSFLLYFNMFGNWVFYGKKPRITDLVGAALGILGLGLIFERDLNLFMEQKNSLGPWVWGLVLAFIATLSASAGNMLTIQYQRLDIPIRQGIAASMSYGCLWVGLITLGSGQSLFQVPTTISFWLALSYLSVLGTVVSFTMYLKLILLWGPARAAYSSLVVPIVAMFFSVFLEDLKLTPLILTGCGLIFVGQSLILRRKQKSN